jgi:hypothetical protein
LLRDQESPASAHVCLQPTHQKQPTPKTNNQRVVAAGPSKNAALGYDWAIVTGGAPSTATDNDACTPPATHDDGIWLFSRSPVAPKADMDAMMAAAKQLRLDTAVLKPVAQAKCTYVGAAA